MSLFFCVVLLSALLSFVLYSVANFLEKVTTADHNIAQCLCVVMVMDILGVAIQSHLLSSEMGSQLLLLVGCSLWGSFPPPISPP